MVATPPACDERWSHLRGDGDHDARRAQRVQPVDLEGDVRHAGVRAGGQAEVSEGDDSGRA
jgi:hypothetical protein